MSNDTLKMLAPAPSGTLRRLFYWISLLVVISIAAQTALEALDVHCFPRRSWSEGISPKVIQTRNSKIYFEFIAVTIFGSSVEASGWRAAGLSGGYGYCPVPPIRLPNSCSA